MPLYRIMPRGGVYRQVTANDVVSLRVSNRYIYILTKCGRVSSVSSTIWKVS